MSYLNGITSFLGITRLKVNHGHIPTYEKEWESNTFQLFMYFVTALISRIFRKTNYTHHILSSK